MFDMRKRNFAKFPAVSTTSGKIIRGAVFPNSHMEGYEPVKDGPGNNRHFVYLGDGDLEEGDIIAFSDLTLEVVYVNVIRLLGLPYATHAFLERIDDYE